MKIFISRQRLFLMFTDMVATNVALIAALLLRFGMDVPSQRMNMYISTVMVYSLINLAIFSYCGFYKHNWRYMTTRNTVRIAGGVLIGWIAYIIFLFFYAQWSYPRTVVVMCLFFSCVFTIGIRLLIHMVYFWGRKSFAKESQRALIIGAGEAAASLISDMLRRENSQYIPFGMLDDDPEKKGMLIHRVEVLGAICDISKVIKRRHFDVIIIAIPTAKSDELRRIVTQCETTGIEVKKVPCLFDILDGKVDISAIKNVEPEDILGRELNIGDIKEIDHYIFGKTIMVTGAGGSIGSELCRQIISYHPKQLILLDSSEFNVYNIDMELSEKFGKQGHTPVVGDVQSLRTMDGIFDRFKPDIVFHAAAYKHVPLMEGNVAAAIKNNVWGTKNMATLAAKYKVAQFVMISTDKAVNPTNVMGASKRMAELVVQSMNGRYDTIFSAVRFGNVLGSNGSVLPLFKKQIAAGGPITITHPEVIRYFMTIPEAVQLVLTSATMAKGGEVYILEMGEPVKILDMAKSLIRLSGLEPEKDIEIKFVGLRPGEKLYEELLTDEEGILKTDCDRIYVGKSSQPDCNMMFEEVEELWHLANTQDIAGILDKLEQLVPGFQRKQLIKATAEEISAGFPEAVSLNEESLKL